MGGRATAHKPIHKSSSVRRTGCLIIRNLNRKKADETIKRFRRKPTRKRERKSDKSKRVIPADGPTSAGRGGEKPLVHTAASRPDDGRRKS